MLCTSAQRFSKIGEKKEKTLMWCNFVFRIQIKMHTNRRCEDWIDMYLLGWYSYFNGLWEMCFINFACQSPFTKEFIFLKQLYRGSGGVWQKALKWWKMCGKEETKSWRGTEVFQSHVFILGTFSNLWCSYDPVCQSLCQFICIVWILDPLSNLNSNVGSVWVLQPNCANDKTMLGQ